MAPQRTALPTLATWRPINAPQGPTLRTRANTTASAGPPAVQAAAAVNPVAGPAPQSAIASPTALIDIDQAAKPAHSKATGAVRKSPDPG